MDTVAIALSHWLARHNLKGARLVVEFENERQVGYAEASLKLDMKPHLVAADPHPPKHPMINGIEVEFRAKK